MDYDRGKDIAPKETVYNIIRILKKIGININIIRYRYSKNNIFPLYSCRVCVDKTLDIGTNGKGTSYYYSLASALGEFMERFQNCCLSGLTKMRPDTKIFNVNDFIKKKKECVPLNYIYQIN